MNNIFIKQAIYVPIVYFGTVILAGFFAENYSHFGQHASELAINENVLAGTIFNIGIFVTGISMILYGAGLIMKFGKSFSITAFLIAIFGVTFLFGAIYAIGSPWHGLYGIGLSTMMLPFAFLYESNKIELSNLAKNISIITAVVLFFYFWAMVARLDPMELRGLTQRIFGIFLFGFLSYSAYLVNKSNVNSS